MAPNIDLDPEPGSPTDKLQFDEEADFYLEKLMGEVTKLYAQTQSDAVGVIQQQLKGRDDIDLLQIRKEGEFFGAVRTLELLTEAGTITTAEAKRIAALAEKKYKPFAVDTLRQTMDELLDAETKQRIRNSLTERTTHHEGLAASFIIEQLLPWGAHFKGKQIDIKEISLEYVVEAKCPASGNSLKNRNQKTLAEQKESWGSDTKLALQNMPYCDRCDEPHIPSTSKWAYTFPIWQPITENQKYTEQLEQRLEQGSQRILGSRNHRMDKKEKKELRREIETKKRETEKLIAEAEAEHKLYWISSRVKGDDRFIDKVTRAICGFDYRTEVNKKMNEDSNSITDIIGNEVGVTSELVKDLLIDYLGKLEEERIISIKEQKDHWNDPKTKIVNGKKQILYQGYKCVVYYGGFPIELQIVTPEMHNNNVEDHPDYIFRTEERMKLLEERGLPVHIVKEIIKEIFAKDAHTETLEDN